MTRRIQKWGYMSLLIKNIKKLVTCDFEDRVLDDVNIYVEDGIIKYIGKDFKESDEVIDAKDMLVYPGLINTHHHLYQTFTRNLINVQNMELFDWLKTLYSIWANLDKDTIRYSSYVGMAELVKNGCTSIFDHHYVFPNNSDEFIDTQFEVASDLGIRFFASRGSMSLSEKDGGLPPDSVVQSTEKILEESERLIKKHHDSSFNSMKEIILAPCSPFSVTGDLMKESAKLARKYKVKLHTHLAETIDEEKFTIEKFGLRPLEYMESLGWVGEDVWYAHGIHFNDYELDLLKETNTGVCHCPISNMKLSSGIARIPEMLEKNIRVGLGVDGSASNDGSNLLEEIRVAYLLHRLNSSNKAPSAYEILKIATKGSASLLNRSDIGSLEEGKACDLFMIDSNRVELVGTLSDPKSLLSTVGIKNPVDYTLVNGKTVVKNGKLVGVSEEEIIKKSRENLKKLYI